MTLPVIWSTYIYISRCHKMHLVPYSPSLSKKIHRGPFNSDVEKYKHYGCDPSEIFRALYSWNTLPLKLFQAFHVRHFGCDAFPNFAGVTCPWVPAVPRGGGGCGWGDTHSQCHVYNCTHKLFLHEKQTQQTTQDSMKTLWNYDNFNTHADSQ